MAQLDTNLKITLPGTEPNNPMIINSLQRKSIGKRGTCAVDFNHPSFLRLTVPADDVVVGPKN